MCKVVVSVVACLVAFSTSALANCYVLQNNTASAQTLHFHYSKPLPDVKTDLTLAPHARWPRTAPLCFNTSADTYATVSIDPGAYTPSWEGTLVLGNGSNALPSDTYSLNPQCASSDSADNSPPAKRCESFITADLKDCLTRSCARPS